MPNDLTDKLRKAMENKDLAKVIEIKEKLFQQYEINDIKFSDLGSVNDFVTELSE